VTLEDTISYFYEMQRQLQKRAANRLIPHSNRRKKA
jgi:hypothetical protein